MEAVALVGETGEAECRVPDPLSEVGRLERGSARRREDELLGRVASPLDRSGGKFPDGVATDGKSGTAFAAPQLGSTWGEGFAPRSPRQATSPACSPHSGESTICRSSKRFDKWSSNAASATSLRSDPTMADRLPRPDRAVVPREKLEGYLLNPGHEVGRHKARVFASALGIQQRDWEYLRDQLEAAIVDASVSTVHKTPWGDLYEVIVPVDGLNGQTRYVMTVWLVATDDGPPRLVTAYVVDEPAGA